MDPRAILIVTECVARGAPTPVLVVRREALSEGAKNLRAGAREGEPVRA